MTTKNDIMGMLSARGIYHESDDDLKTLERIARENGLLKGDTVDNTPETEVSETETPEEVIGYNFDDLSDEEIKKIAKENGITIGRSSRETLIAKITA